MLTKLDNLQRQLQTLSKTNSDNHTTKVKEIYFRWDAILGKT